jgi:hypothetical protein
MALGLAVAERMEDGTSTAFVGVQLGHARGLEAADLEAVLYGALLKDVGCGAVLVPFFLGQELAAWLDGLWLRGVTGRASRSRHLLSACRDGFAPSRLRVPAGRCIAGPGPRRSASRALTLLAQPGTRRSRDTVRPGQRPLATNGREDK